MKMQGITYKSFELFPKWHPNYNKATFHDYHSKLFIHLGKFYCVLPTLILYVPKDKCVVTDPLFCVCIQPQ